MRALEVSYLLPRREPGNHREEVPFCADLGANTSSWVKRAVVASKSDAFRAVPPSKMLSTEGSTFKIS
jgi:hypothetical protein